MLKNKLKLLFNRLPTRLKIVCWNIYRTIIVRRVYDSPDHFPLNYIKKLNLPIFGRSSKIGYFYRLYQEKRSSFYLLPESLFDYKYEIIYGEHRDVSKTIEAPKTDVIVPVCLESERSNLIVKNNNTNEEDRLKNLPENFILAGGYEIISALVGCPSLLRKDKGYPPLLWLSSLHNSEDNNICYHLEPYGYNLTFNRRAHLNKAAEYWWHSIAIIV